MDEVPTAILTAWSYHTALFSWGGDRSGFCLKLEHTLAMIHFHTVNTLRDFAEELSLASSAAILCSNASNVGVREYR